MLADCLPDCLPMRCRPPRGKRRVQHRPGMKAMYFKRKKQCCRPLSTRRHLPDEPRYYHCCFFTFFDIRIPAWICGVLLLCAALNQVAVSQPRESLSVNHLPLCTASMPTVTTGSCLPLYCRTRYLASDLCVNKVWDAPHTAGSVRTAVCGRGLPLTAMDSLVGRPPSP